MSCPAAAARQWLAAAKAVFRSTRSNSDVERDRGLALVGGSGQGSSPRKARKRGRPIGSRLQRSILARVDVAPVASSDAAPSAPSLAAESAAPFDTHAPALLALTIEGEQCLQEVLTGDGARHTYAHRKAMAMVSLAIEDMYASAQRELIVQVCRDIARGQAHGVLFCLTRAYDETPLKCRVLERTADATSASSVAADLVELQKTTAKIVAHFRGFALLVKYRNEDGSFTYHRIAGQLPTRLKVVANQTQRIVEELLRQFRMLDADLRTVIEQAFPRRLVISCADSHASNIASERGDDAEDIGWHHLQCRCFIHRVDTAEKKGAPTSSHRW